MDHASQGQCLTASSQQNKNHTMESVTACQTKDTLGIKFQSIVITSTSLQTRRMEHLQSQKSKYGKLYHE